MSREGLACLCVPEMQQQRGVRGGGGGVASSCQEEEGARRQALMAKGPGGGGEEKRPGGSSPAPRHGPSLTLAWAKRAQVQVPFPRGAGKGKSHSSRPSAWAPCEQAGEAGCSRQTSPCDASPCRSRPPPADSDADPNQRNHGNVTGVP